ncbi:phage tail spike protein [Anaerotignum sp. MB30-C6]|uniref:phage tail spike protein n=1 Tax=Anaerotignum sp. MB30-C6 TaxID=3070814 RepID=UPI0027DB9E9E|nr:phage tail spike protein [Anaerotignum sp. MB30-C6]WMI81854.1 phage tail spike protein [Anaerotignum sp. MB30-C6]
MVTIHEKNSIAFNTLGLGALLPSLCTVTEELNGLYELEMEHPYDEQGKWKHIEKERIIFASTPRGRQPFRIYHVNPKLDGGRFYIKVYAKHIFYDLLDNLCLSVNVTGTPQVALSAIKGSLAYAVPFVLSTDMTGTGTVKATRVNPITSLLNMDEDKDSFVKAFGGEILRDGFAVTMKTSIGEDRGVAIRYGKNLVGLEISEDVSEVATRILPIGKDGLQGSYVDSQYINNYVYPKIRILEDSQIETTPELQQAALNLLAEGVDLPKVNIKADFHMLSKTEEYKEYAVLEEVQLGDVVTVSNVKMGFHKKAKVISYEWDCLLERYNRVELGDFVADLTTSVTAGEKSLSTAVSAKSTASTAATDAQTALDRILRKVTINNEGLYICVDTNSLDTATKVFHFGSYGLRHSSTGVNGTYKTIIDGDGNLV